MIPSAVQIKDNRSAEALLAPGITLIVITARFPEAGLVLVYKLNRTHPFGALPEVPLWNQGS
jgi:hypothetical protein